MLMYSFGYGQNKIISVNLPKVDTLILEAYSEIDTVGGYEISGFVKSRTYDNIFWGVNDSGDPPRVVPFRRDGALIKNYRGQKINGHFIGGAMNSDWEDITIDNDGFLYISDLGNNCNCRRDLVFYKIIENDPTAARTHVFEKVFVRYPDQNQFPAPRDNFNFDSEGVFWANGKMYVFSKHRSDTRTKLYRLDKIKSGKVNVLKQIGTFDIQGMVTAADASVDGKRIAVLTYGAVWVFEAQKKGDYLNGSVWYRPVKATQIESICFDGNNLIVIDEVGGKMYEVGLEDLVKVK